MKLLLEVKDLMKLYFLRKGLVRHSTAYVKAVDEVSFGVKEGEVFGLIGESGSGKTTIARLVLGLEEATSGSITFDGTSISTSLNERTLKKYRIQIGAVFQDPFDSINPMMNVYTIVSEPLEIAEVKASKSEKIMRVQTALRDVKLTPPEEFMAMYPHELSGGQRQRVSLARALMLRPKLIIADEPLSMLDVSLRADMLNLMEDMKERYKLTILFITHDLAVARYFCDNVAVIYKGKLMEIGLSEEIFRRPRHPYTMALKEAVPEIGKRIEYSDNGFETHETDRGCPFRPRCRYADVQCIKIPEMVEESPEHSVACFKA